MRLQRFLAQCGLGSRRECEELITDGRVTIDGEVASQLGSTVDPARQTVELDGERLRLERKKYFLLNKPPGYLCTAKDPQGRPVVLDLFPDEGPRLFTVGRLDENTTGLLIVTNDGDLAQKLAHPRYRIYRLYRAQVAGNPDREIFDQLKQGFFFTEGKFRVHDIVPVKRQKGSTWVEITMTEGQNREIRRLLARVGHKVMKLERIGFGPIRLGRVPLGQYRELRMDELGKLHEILERNQSTPARESTGSKPRSRPGKRVASQQKSEGKSATSGPKKKSTRSVSTRQQFTPAGKSRPAKGAGGNQDRGPTKGKPSGNPKARRPSSGSRPKGKSKRRKG